MFDEVGRPDVGPVLRLSNQNRETVFPRPWRQCRPWSECRIKHRMEHTLPHVVRRRPICAGDRRRPAPGGDVGLAPTMGAAQGPSQPRSRGEGGMRSRRGFDLRQSSQFGPHEDFSKYPRTLDADLAALAGCGADLVFAPPNEEIYRSDHATWVEVGAVAEPLEGVCRPGHFRGVATVVLKLFNLAEPDVAYFGQKDFQQVCVIRKMAADLNLPVAIRTCPIVREPDGLAMSSRNRYLSPAARQRALAVEKPATCRPIVGQGERHAEMILAQMRKSSKRPATRKSTTSRWWTRTRSNRSTPSRNARWLSSP